MSDAAASAYPYRILNRTQPDTAFRGRCALAIMAKAPVPGKVKTRLSPPLTPLAAAELNACFLRDTIANLADAAQTVPAEVVISYTPVGEERAFLGVAPHGTLLLPQRGDGFGERLLRTAKDLFACGFSTVCLIDSDSPTVPTDAFRTAVQQLAAPGRRAVLGPSVDGGYYLIGMQGAEANLFDRITWSTDRVAAETLERAQEIGLPMTLLPEWYDVDDAASLERLQRELALPLAGARAYPSPHTREYLGIQHPLVARADRMENEPCG